MKQRHSFHRLYYHLVFNTKNRERFIESERDGEVLRGFFGVKARDLDVYIEEFGCWREHVHIFLRCGTTRALSDVYSQLKGFAAAAWRRRFPGRPFKWGDGVYIETVTPDESLALRKYIRNQWEQHEAGETVECWEREESTPP